MDVKLGVIGAGYISRFHFRAYEELKTPVVAVSDLDAERAAPYVKTFGATYCRDYRELLANPQVNTVAVLGPTPVHYEISKAALEHGKHVICEKTLTLNARDSLDLARLAEQKNLILYTSYMKRFFPAVQKARDLMPSLGHIMSVYCRTYQGVDHDIHTGPVLAAWARGADGKSPIMRMAGGGVLICGGSHIFDLLLFLVGRPKRVYATQLHRQESDLDLMTHALFDLAGGGAAHFEGNWHPLHRVGYQKRGWDEGFEISGVNGRLVLETPIWNQPEHDAATLRHYDNATGAWTDYSFDIVCPFGQAERHFLSQIARGEQGPQDRYTGYRADYLLEATQRSASKQQPVDLAWEA